MPGVGSMPQTDRKKVFLDMLHSSPTYPTSPGEIWYIVNTQFICDETSDYVGEDFNKLKIENAPLLRDPLTENKISQRSPLKSNKLTGEFFEVVNEPTWKKFVELGIEFDVEIPRNVYELTPKTYKVETQPLELWVFPKNKNLSSNGFCTPPFRVLLSRNDSLTYLHNQVATVLSKPESSIRLFWAENTTCHQSTENICFAANHKTPEAPDADILSSSSTLTKSEEEIQYKGRLRDDKPPIFPVDESWLPVSKFDQMDENVVILAEIADLLDNCDEQVKSSSSTAVVPFKPVTSTGRQWESPPSVPYTFPQFPGSDEAVARKALHSGGLVGLQNIGNTCFMNTGLQCLLHILPLTEYFLTDEYQKDINFDNPLGMNGKLATEYARFLFDFWETSRRAGVSASTGSVVVPSWLKHVVGRFAPQFVGYQQQDSQEFLAFLLDGLHEDLNRIKKKPYVEAFEADESKCRKDVATESWKRHTMRNDSIIVDMFQGQYHSRLQCPNCNKVSIVFDPFMYLSLPVPKRGRNPISCTLVALPTGIPPVKFSLLMRGDVPLSALKEAIVDKVKETALSVDSSIITTGNSNTAAVGDYNRLDAAGALKEILLSYGDLTPSMILVMVGNSADITLALRIMEKETLIREPSRTYATPSIRQESFFAIVMPVPFVSFLEKSSANLLSNELLSRDISPPSADFLFGESNKKRRALFNNHLSNGEFVSGPKNITDKADINMANATTLPQSPLTSTVPSYYIYLFIVCASMNQNTWRNGYTYNSGINTAGGGSDNMYPLCVAMSRTATSDEVYERVAAVLTGITQHTPNVSQVAEIRSNEPIDVTKGQYSWEEESVTLPLEPLFGEEQEMEIVNKVEAVSCSELQSDTQSKEPDVFVGKAECDTQPQLSPEQSKTSQCKLTADCNNVQRKANIGDCCSGGVTVAHYDQNGHNRSYDSSTAYVGNSSNQDNNIELDIVIVGKDRMMNLSSGNNLHRHVKVERDGTPFLSYVGFGNDIRWCVLKVRTTREIGVTIIEDNVSIDEVNNPVRDDTASVSLQECLEDFLKTEELGFENMWYCNGCCDHVQAFKKIDLFKLPNVLVIHLKRFSQQSRYHRTKNDILVKFPWDNNELLDLSQFVLEEATADLNFSGQYELISISEHIGYLGGGHYTAKAKCIVNGIAEWHDFDDQFHRKTLGDVCRQGAYVLFYQKLIRASDGSLKPAIRSPNCIREMAEVRKAADRQSFNERSAVMSSDSDDSGVPASLNISTTEASQDSSTPATEKGNLHRGSLSSNESERPSLSHPVDGAQMNLSKLVFGPGGGKME